MTSLSPTRAAVRAVDAPFVFGLGLVGIGVASRVAWAARGGAVVLLVPPALVAVIVAAGTIRVWQDLRAAAEAERSLAAFEGREGECSPAALSAAKAIAERTASTLPAVCILVGLLGTFAGLFEALVGARELLGSAVDAASLRAIVGAPLAGLARAFGSSAAGIVGSIVLGSAEGRFQGAGDAIAIRVAAIEERLRAVAIGEEVRRAIASSDSVAREAAEREARVEALLTRVAAATEAHASAHAGYHAAVVAELGRVGVRVERLQSASEGTHSAVRDLAASDVASLAALEGAVRGLATAQTATGATIEGAVRELAAARSAHDVALEEAVRAIAANGNAAAVSAEQVASSVQAIGPAVGATVEQALARAGEAHARLLEDAKAVHEASLSAALASYRAHEERAATHGSALAEAAAGLREHAARSADESRALLQALGAEVVTSLSGALAEWSRCDEARAAKEDAERRARWDDDDARRAEWSGAEKLILQSAMDLIAERLAAVGDVHARVVASLEALASTQRSFETLRAESTAAETARLERAERALTEALDRGSERLAAALGREGGALLESVRVEVGRAVAGVDAHAAALAKAATDVEAAGAERVVALDERVRSVSEHVADVARAVETLAEVLKAAPLELSSDAAAASAAPGVPVAAAGHDDDRAAFVACLEEARRWFDATQTLQQRILDEALQVRGPRP
jgi:hypothetical protein